MNNINKDENTEEKKDKSQSYSMIEESLIKKENESGLESGFLEVFVKPKLIEKEDELIEGKEYEIYIMRCQNMSECLKVSHLIILLNLIYW